MKNILEHYEKLVSGNDSSENLTGQLQLFLWGKLFVERINIGIIYVITMWGLVDARDTIQIPRNQFLAEEEGGIRILRQIMIPYAKLAGIVKTALAVKSNVALKKDSSKAHLCCLLQRVVQYGFSVSFAFQFRCNADRPHGENRDLSAVIGFEFQIVSGFSYPKNLCSSILHQ